jgi:hypothetical protein
MAEAHNSEIPGQKKGEHEQDFGQNTGGCPSELTIYTEEKHGQESRTTAVQTPSQEEDSQQRCYSYKQAHKLGFGEVAEIPLSKEGNQGWIERLSDAIGQGRAISYHQPN